MPSFLGLKELPCTCAFLSSSKAGTKQILMLKLLWQLCSAAVLVPIWSSSLSPSITPCCFFNNWVWSAVFQIFSGLSFKMTLARVYYSNFSRGEKLASPDLWASGSALEGWFPLLICVILWGSLFKGVRGSTPLFEKWSSSGLCQRGRKSQPVTPSRDWIPLPGVQKKEAELWSR